MHRTALQLLDDILESTEKIEKYIHGISFDEFTSDEMRKDAVIRNFEIIGEAIKNLPEGLKKSTPEPIGKRSPVSAMSSPMPTSGSNPRSCGITPRTNYPSSKKRSGRSSKARNQESNGDR